MPPLEEGQLQGRGVFVFETWSGTAQYGRILLYSEENLEKDSILVFL